MPLSAESKTNETKAFFETDLVGTKAVMKVTKCPHINRKHYAKNMCSSCYRKYGRNQNAWNCAHKDRLLYSMGMC